MYVSANVVVVVYHIYIYILSVCCRYICMDVDAYGPKTGLALLRVFTICRFGVGPGMGGGAITLNVIAVFARTSCSLDPSRIFFVAQEL